MATKLQRISELANQTARSVTRNAGNWMRYLETASRIYKYSFDDQLLIYAQRPDATACASMELWNQRMRRWIQPGSKSIALIHKDTTGWPTLDYVFDVSDTRALHGAKTLYLWQLREDHYATVKDTVVRQYGPMEETEIGGVFMEQVRRAADTVYRECLPDLVRDMRNSPLEKLDATALEARFKNLLIASVQFTVLTRCGLNASDYLDENALSGITDFSTPAVLHHLGDAVSTLSMWLLNEIGRAVRDCERELLKNQKRNLENFLAKPAEIVYT